MKKIELILKKLTGAVSLVSYVGIVFIMLITVFDIFLRLLTSKSVIGCYEIVQVTLMCAVFASFAYAQSEKGHVSITLIISKLPKKISLFIFGLTGLLSSFIAVMLSYAALIQAQNAAASNYMTSVLLIPMTPFYYVEAVGMIVFFIALLFDAMKSFVGIFNKDIAEEITSTWN